MERCFDRALGLMAIVIVALLGPAGCGSDGSGSGSGQGVAGPKGADGKDGNDGNDGDDGKPGAKGDPGPKDATKPPAPENLRVFRPGDGSAEFELRWELEGSEVPVQFFTVYASDAKIQDADASAVESVEPGAARASRIALTTNTGHRHFRVSATSYTGVEGPLSPEYVVDTTGRVVFTGDLTTEGIPDLYSVLAGSGDEPLNLTQFGGTPDLRDLALSPDGRFAAYAACVDTPGVSDIYVVPLDGSSPPVKVSGTLGAGEVIPASNPIPSVLWSPDGGRLAFVKHDGDPLALDLFVTTPDGAGNPVRINHAAKVDINHPRAIQWLPDGHRVVFQSHEVDNLFLRSVHVANADGSGTAELISGPLAGGGSVLAFSLSPDGKKIAFLGDVEGANTDLYVAPTDGKTDRKKVNEVGLSGASSFFWSPDSTRLAFDCGCRTAGAFEVFVVTPSSDAPPVPLASAYPAAADLVRYAWSPDGTFIAFAADMITDDVFEVFVASASGGTPPFRFGGSGVLGASANDLSWAPVGHKVVFTMDRLVDSRFEVFVADLDAGSLQTASGVAIATADANDPLWSPDGTRLLFQSNRSASTTMELYVGSSFAGEPAAVSGMIGANADVGSLFFWSPLSNP